MITQEQIKNLFKYKNGFLYWKSLASAKNNNGKIAGGHWKNGYCRVSINKKSYLYHRVIYLFHNKDLPELIDHINGDPSDNRIQNLRAANRSENNKNAKLRKNSKTGVKGVSWDDSKRKFLVRITSNNKTVNLGRFKTLEEAKIKIESVRREYHGDFCNHGVCV